VRVLRTAGLALVAAFVLLGQSSAADPARKPATYEERAGLLVTPMTALPSDAPATKELTPPAFPDAYAVWSSTGRDLGGRIWYGISANSPGMSAHLMQYDPESDTWKDRGAVVERLRAASLLRAGEGQIKIHSRMVTAEDGWIYFASHRRGRRGRGRKRPAEVGRASLAHRSRLGRLAAPADRGGGAGGGERGGPLRLRARLLGPRADPVRHRQRRAQGGRRWAPWAATCRATSSPTSTVTPTCRG
jgi:hypothetical protein